MIPQIFDDRMIVRKDRRAAFDSEDLLLAVIDSLVLGWRNQACDKLGKSIVMILRTVYVADPQRPQYRLQAGWICFVQLNECSAEAYEVVLDHNIPNHASHHGARLGIPPAHAAARDDFRHH